MTAPGPQRGRRGDRVFALALAACLALAAALASAARAETVRVLTGEHGRFTRIALVLGQATPWRLGRTAAGYEFRLARPGITFDTGDAFRRIPRTRVAGLQAEESRLAIVLGCNCHATAFEDRPGLIVIDIRDGAAPPGSAFEARLDAPAPEGRTPAGLRPMPRPARRPPANAPQPDDFLDLYWRGTPLPQPSPAAEGPAPDTAANRDATGGGEDRLVEAQDHLLRMLARAAAQGMVDPLPPPATAARPAAAPGPAAAAPPAPTPPAPPPPTPAAVGPGLRAETGLDRDLREPPRLVLTPEGSACLPDDALDLAAWGDGRPPAVQIAEARQALLGEFDRPDPAGVDRLVRLYLNLGFGAEALAALKGLGGGSDAAPHLVEIAAVLDDRPARTGAFAGMEACATAAALWALLAGPRPGRAERIDRAAVQRAFSALPLHLRRLLGPGLAEVFLGLGDVETARALRDAILRAPGAHGDGVEVLAARVELARGRVAAADAALARLAAEGGAGAAEALALLIESRLARGEPVDEAQSAAAAALAFERRGTPAGTRLAAAHVLAEAARGAFGSAFAALGRLEAEDVAAAAPVRGEVLRRLAEQGSDADFLRHAFAASATLPPPIGPGSLREAEDAAVRRALARRFLALGFGAEAQAALGPEAGLAGDDRTLWAAAALAADAPRDALRALAGLAGAEPARLRAEALTRIGDHAGASAAYATAGLEAEARDAAWRAGDWTGLLAQGDDPRAGLVAALLDPGGADAAAGADKPLAAARGLLEDSAAARRAIEGIMRVAAVPPDERRPAGNAAPR